MLLLMWNGFFGFLPDQQYNSLMFRMHFGYKLDLDHPATMNEKIQWLKLYDHNPAYTDMVDKYKAKKLAAERIGEDHIIPTLGVWERYEDIPFDSLPDQFVLKCTHDSGGIVICKSKEALDYKNAEKKIKKSLSNDFYKLSREWPYKNVPHRVICEPYLSDDEDTDQLTDYKIFCFDGKVGYILVCKNRFAGQIEYATYDRNWNKLHLSKVYEDHRVERPANLDEMVKIAEKLAEDLAYVRIDLYNLNGKIYFGEWTFYSDGGFDTEMLPEKDLYYGEMIDLSKIHKR